MTTKRVLIVEDEAIVAMALSRALPRFGYHVCRVFASGEEAIEGVENERPDLILMDIHLVGALDGIQAADHIRARYDIPIVFMTGYDISHIQDRTRHLTNVAHVGKPVGIQTLAEIIAGMLTSAAP